MADRVLGGRYTVQDKIGAGGMAVVYRGLDNVLGRTVAIKTMLPQYANDPSFAARFKQEAQAAAALQSPYIVSVYDWGKDGETYYIVMEYLRGTDLKSGIRSHGALDCRKVAQIGLEIAQALSVAHKHDIIHRDIKPQNIMVQPDGNIKVMDFGIARAKNSHLTQDNSVLGTAHYVSPEQTQGKELGPTSDIYSLGIVMYEAACGSVPFEGDDAISVALKQVNEQPVPPSERNPNVDSSLESIILKCMQKDPADRFQTADELSHALRDYLAGRTASVAAATRVMGGVVPVGDQTEAMPRAEAPLPATNVSRHGSQKSATSEAEERERKSKRRLVTGIVLGIVAVVAVVAIAMSILGSGSESSDVPNLYGMTEDEAVAKIESDDFFQVGDITEEYSDDVAEGEVMSQDPAAGSTATKGTKIDLVISKGEKPAGDVEVPDLTDMTPEEANAALTKVGLVGEAGDSVYSSEVETGHVAQQDTAAGTTVKEGDTVVYHLSQGVEQLDVPDVTGMSASKAESALESAGFTASMVEGQQASSSSQNGLVYWQSPSSGTADAGSTVTCYYYADYVAPTSPTSPSDSSDTDSSSSSDTSGDTTTG
jgi:beta-lactam-binding protein with PASTA domain